MDHEAARVINDLLERGRSEIPYASRVRAKEMVRTLMARSSVRSGRPFRPVEPMPIRITPVDPPVFREPIEADHPHRPFRER